MNHKEFEAKLLKEFPNLYVDMYGPIQVTSMACGVSIEPGWYDIVYDLSQKLERLILAIPKNARGNYKAAQVKEKFGGLRFHMNSSTLVMESLIDKAEELSLQTCQTCGKPGKTLGSGLIYTACKDHAKKRDLEHFEEKK